MRKSTLFEKINKYLLYLVGFATPLLIFPLTQNYLNYPKRIFVLVLVVFSLVAWILRQKFRGKILLRKVDQKLYWICGFVLLTFALSTIFSLWQGISFWGAPYSVSDNLLNMIVLFGLSFLLVHSFEKRKEYFNFIFSIILSGALVGAFSLLRIFDVTIFNLNPLSLIGNFNAVAIFSAALFPLALAFTFFFSKKKRIVSGLSALILLALVTLINFQVAWLVLLLGVLTALFFATWRTDEDIKLGLPVALMLVLALSLFFVLFRFPIPFFPTRPAEVSLSLGSEYDVLRGTFSENVKNIILGSGPGTFLFKYSLHRSPLLNQTIFWGTRFREGSSAFLDWIITKGLLGGASLILLWGFTIVTGIKDAVFSKDSSYWKEKLVILSVFIALVGGFFLYPFNFTLLFLFFVILGLLIGLISSEFKEIELENNPYSFVLPLILIVAIILGGGLMFLQGIRYYAANQYYRASVLSNQGETDKAITKLTKATNLTTTPLNSPVDLYYRDLAQLHLNRANQVAQDQSVKNPGLVQTSVNRGMQSLERATQIAPFNAANWNVRGFFYRNLLGLENADTFAINSYKKATELEPASPFAYVEMARVYILTAQQEEAQKNNYLNKAATRLEKAIELKPDYAPAHYLMAVVYDQQGNLDKAITKLQDAELSAARDIGLTFQLGLLYWRQGDVGQAQAKFQQAVNANPKYSNARYMLGLAYDNQGQKQAALNQFRKVAELNPDNERVKKIITNLENGEPAMKDVESTTAPLQDTPQEIKE